MQYTTLKYIPPEQRTYVFNIVGFCHLSSNTKQNLCVRYNDFFPSIIRTLLLFSVSDARQMIEVLTFLHNTVKINEISMHMAVYVYQI